MSVVLNNAVLQVGFTMGLIFSGNKKREKERWKRERVSERERERERSVETRQSI